MKKESSKKADYILSVICDGFEKILFWMIAVGLPLIILEQICLKMNLNFVIALFLTGITVGTAVISEEIRKRL